jgi:hypothetical protein
LVVRAEALKTSLRRWLQEVFHQLAAPEVTVMATVAVEEALLGSVTVKVKLSGPE